MELGCWCHCRVLFAHWGLVADAAAGCRLQRAGGRCCCQSAVSALEPGCWCRCRVPVPGAACRVPLQGAALNQSAAAGCCCRALL